MESSASSLRLPANSRPRAASSFRGAPPGARPLNGPGLQVLPPAVKKTLHGSREHLKVAAVEIGIKRRRIQVEKAPEEGIRLPGEGKGETLGQIDLVDIPLADVVLDAGERLKIGLPGKIALEGPHPVRTQGTAREQRRLGGAGLRAAPAILIAYLNLPVAIGPAVVYHQAPGEGQDHFRQAQIILGPGGQTLQVVFQIIGQEAQTSRAQGRQGRLSGRIPGSPTGPPGR